MKHLNAAISALDQSVPKPGAAAAALREIQGTFAVDSFDDEVYRRHILRMAPGYYRLAWGEQAHLAPLLDVIDEYHAVQTASWQTAEELDQLVAQSWR